MPASLLSQRKDPNRDAAHHGVIAGNGESQGGLAIWAGRMMIGQGCKPAVVVPVSCKAGHPVTISRYPGTVMFSKSF